jgi:SEL1 protein
MTFVVKHVAMIVLIMILINTSSSSSNNVNNHNTNKKNMDDIVNQHLLSAEAQQLYEKAEAFGRGTLNVKQNIERAEALYRKASRLTGPFAAAALNALAKLAKHPKDKLHFYNQSALRGNPNSHFMMGVFHSTGLFEAEINQGKALLHFHFAAIGNDTKGAMAAGYRIFHGVGVAKDCKRASIYYEIAANAVVDEADRKSMTEANEQKVLSDAFYKTNQKSNDDVEVLQYFQYAADKGDKRGLIGLGQLYYYGLRGLKRDFVKAFHLFKKAVTLHKSGAGYANMGHMYLNGFVTDEIESMDSNIALAPSSSSKKNVLSIDYDYDDLHDFSYNQNNGNKKYKKAKEMFSSSIQAGNSFGYAGLGVMFLWGLGIEQNIEHAVHLLKKASDAGNAHAHYTLGVLNLGLSIPNTEKYRNFRTASQHFHVASQAGHLHARHKLGNMNLHGIGMKKNCRAAVQLFKKVAEAGQNVLNLKRAHALVSARSNGGYGLYDKDQRALVLYAMAAEMGFQRAQENAAWVYEKILRANQKLHLGIQSNSDNSNNKNGETPGIVETGSDDNSNKFEHDKKKREEEESRKPFGLRMWELAAAQDNIRASLRVGDFFYSGLLGTTVDYKRAAAQYQQAAKLGSAQALFNLGYMHQLGLGFHTKDFHLAKRQYDTAIAKNRDAYVPCTLALHYLYFQSAWETSVDWAEFFGCLYKSLLARWIYPKQFELFLGSKKM